jgi:membrane associated rhomboid family serine protease
VGRVLPLRDENPTRRKPVVTIALVVANVAAFVLLQQGRPETEVVPVDIETEVGDPVDQVELPGELSFNLRHAAIPCEVVSGEPLSTDEVVATYSQGDPEACAVDLGLGEQPLFPDKAVWLAILSSMFLHGGWWHLAGNMVFLWVFGNNIEDHLGHVRYLAFYVAGGLAATLAHVAAQPASTIALIGASGAVAAVMGAYLVWFPNARVRTLVFFFLILFVEVRAKWLLLGWFVLQFFTGSDSGVAWVAHVGGFVLGVALALWVRASRVARRALLTPDHRSLGGW